MKTIKMIAIFLLMSTITLAGNPTVASVTKTATTAVTSAKNSVTGAVDSLINKVKPNLTVNIHADSMMSNLRGIVPDSVLPFYKEVYGDLKAGIATIASGLGVAAKELFEVLCVQQVVKSITNISFMIFAILFGIWAYRLGRKINWGGDEISFRGVACTVMGGICLFFSIWTFVNSKETITGFVNPKYGAIKDVVEMASDIKNGDNTRTHK